MSYDDRRGRGGRGRGKRGGNRGGRDDYRYSSIEQNNQPQNPPRRTAGQQSDKQWSPGAHSPRSNGMEDGPTWQRDGSQYQPSNSNDGRNDQAGGYRGRSGGGGGGGGFRSPRYQQDCDGQRFRQISDNQRFEQDNCCQRFQDEPQQSRPYSQPYRNGRQNTNGGQGQNGRFGSNDRQPQNGRFGQQNGRPSQDVRSYYQNQQQYQPVNTGHHYYEQRNGHDGYNGQTNGYQNVNNDRNSREMTSPRSQASSSRSSQENVNRPNRGGRGRAAKVYYSQTGAHRNNGSSGNGNNNNSRPIQQNSQQPPTFGRGRGRGRGGSRGTGPRESGAQQIEMKRESETENSKEEMKTNPQSSPAREIAQVTQPPQAPQTPKDLKDPEDPEVPQDPQAPKAPKDPQDPQDPSTPQVPRAARSTSRWAVVEEDEEDEDAATSNKENTRQVAKEESSMALESAAEEKEPVQKNDCNKNVIPINDIVKPLRELDIDRDEQLSTDGECSESCDSESIISTSDATSIASTSQLDSNDVFERRRNEMRKYSDRVVVTAPRKAPASKHDKKKISLLVNMWQLTLDHHIVYRYDVAMNIVQADGSRISLSKDARDDNSNVERNRLCILALKRALEGYRILRENERALHDGAAIMYASAELEAALKPHQGKLEFPITRMGDDMKDLIKKFKSRRLQRLKKTNAKDADARHSHGDDYGEFVNDDQLGGVLGIEVLLSPCADAAAAMDVADLKEQCNNNMANLDRSWKQFLDILTNQAAIQGNYTLFGAGKLFSLGDDSKRKEFGRGCELVLGMNKGIKFIDDPSEPNKFGSTVPALVLDSKVGIFFKSQNLCASLRERCSDISSRNIFEPRIFNAVNQFVKGLRLTFAHNLSMMAMGISRQPISAIQNDAKRIVNFAAPWLRLGYQCDGSLPAVVALVHNVKRYFPLEHLTIAPGQRLPLSKDLGLGPPKADNAVTRYRQIMDSLSALDLDDGGKSNHYLSAFGVGISPSPKRITGFRRAAPTVLYGNRKESKVNADKASWQQELSTKFVEPGQTDRIVCLGPPNAKEALDAIARMCRQKGIRIGTTSYVPLARDADVTKEVEACMVQLRDERNKNGGLTSILILIDNNDTHKSLKLLERKYLIPTQQLRTKNAYDVAKKPATCSNIVNKLNLKIGGLNSRILPEYHARDIWISESATLVIGYDVAHPGKPSRDEVLNNACPMKPSTVGFACNAAPNPEKFIGDFHYQTPRCEQVAGEVLNARTKWMLRLFLKNRGCLPERIIVVRDGVSEGQYLMAMEEELGAIREACLEFGVMNNIEEYKPKFLLSIVTKRHNLRLFASEREGQIANPPALTVVDTDIVRNDITECIIQSHRAIQGTAKSPTYQILVDEIGLSMEAFQAFMIALSFHHQICDSAISLPEPVYQSDAWASRGKDMFAAYNDLYNLPMKDDKRYCNGKAVDFEEMTKRLSYWNTCLEDRRINA